jgi:hypothetical protein
MLRIWPGHHVYRNLTPDTVTGGSAVASSRAAGFFGALFICSSSIDLD